LIYLFFGKYYKTFVLIFCYLVSFKSYTPVYVSFALRRRYCDYPLEILSVRPLRTRNFTAKMSGTMELRSKRKAPPPPPAIRPMALAYQGKAQTMEVILRTAQRRPVDQRVTIYHGLTQVIMNQEHNVVEAAKNAMIEIEKDGELKGSLGNKEWDNAFADIRKLSKITHKVDEIKTVRDTVKKEWGQKLLEGPCKFFYTCYALKSIRIFNNQASKSRISRADALEMINNAMLNRLELSKAGILRTLYPTPSDFLTAHKFGLEVDEKLVKKWKLARYPSQGHKLLVPASTIETEEEESVPEPVTPAPQLLPFEEVKGSTTKMLRSSFLFGGKVSEAEAEDSESDGSTSSDDILAAGSPQKRRAGKASKKSPRKKRKMGTAEPLVSGGANKQKGKAAMITKADGEAIVGKIQMKRKIKCSCHSETPVELIKTLDSKKELEGGILAVLQQFIAAWQGNGTEVRALCRIHLQKMAGLLGLDASASSAKLYLRIHSVSENYDAIDVLRTAESSYFWFKRDSRPEHANDGLGIYAYSGMRPSEYQVDSVGLRKLVLGSKGELEWDLLGIHHANLFEWWIDAGILDVFKEEFNMYAHHLRKTAGKDDSGILRTMCHSLLQQVVRMDLEHYRHTVALRTDGATRFIAYPSYALRFLEGHLPEKRNLDIDLLRVREGGPNSGESWLHSCVSLIDEGSQSCVKLLPGMHQHIPEWVGLLQERGELDSRGRIKNMEAAWTEADAEKFKLNWMPIALRTGEVRFMKATVAQGASQATSSRLIVTPDLIAILPNTKRLEIPGLESQQAVTWMNLDAFPPVLTPTGTPITDVPPYKFPAYIQLQAKSALSNALVGRLSWDDPRVRAEQRIILDPTLNNEYEAFRERHRARVAEIVQDGFKELEEFEREVFGAKSYFLAKEQGHRRPADDLEYPGDSVSDPEYEDNLVGMTSGAPPLTDHCSEGYSEGDGGAITPQGARTAALNLSPGVFNDEVEPIEIERELKDMSKLEGDGFRSAASEHSPVFADALKNINKPAVLHRPTPSPISEEGAASGEQTVDSSVLQSRVWKTMQAEMDTVRKRVSSKLQVGAVDTQDDVSAELEAEDVAEVDEIEVMVEEGVQAALEELKEY
jgi:hypothetical protein